VLDLDGFKEVNDTLGHPRRRPALGGRRRISGCVRAGDTVTRLGGDEFGVLLPGSNGGHGHATADRILAELRLPFSVAARWCGYPGASESPSRRLMADFADMLRDADSALYAAKSVGGNTAQAFQPEMYERVAHRMERRRRPVA
jgi:diguanylate cyclase (GGDEF)-like protein